MLKSLFAKLKKPKGEAAASPEKRTPSAADNPYLTARRTWNEHVGAVVSSRQTWQIIGILSMLIALSAIGGVIYIGSQSKFVPYVVEVDRLGQVRAAGALDVSVTPNQRVMAAAVADFISDARLVTPDVNLQRKAVFRIYAKLSASSPATNKMNEWLNATEQSSPFARAATEMVSVEIQSVLLQSNDTWQVDWVETVRDRSGVMKEKPVNWRALVTVYIAAPTSQTTDEQMRMNPMGIFIRDFSWSRTM